MISGTRSALVAAVTCLAFATSLASAAPQITNISPRAIASNGSTDLTVVGKNLGGETKLVFAIPGVKSQRVGAAKNDRLTFRVTTRNLPTDFHLVRVINASGISNAIIMACDDLQPSSTGPTAVSVPCSLEGALTGSRIDRYSFTGSRGDRVAVGVESQRLDSSLRPVVRLYDPRGAQIAWSAPSAELQGDAHCQATLAIDGTYSIEVHDRTYRGAAPGFYRLKIGDFKTANYIYPTGVQRGSATQVKWLAQSPGLPDPPASVKTSHPAGTWPTPIPGDIKLSGGAPAMYVTDFPQFIEGAATTYPTPSAVSGVLSTAGESDQIRFTVKSEAKYRVEVVSAAFGTPLDGVLTIKSVDGRVLLTNDDQANLADPMATFQAPKGATEVVASLTDLAGRGGPDFVYRMVVQPQRPQWRVVSQQGEIQVPISGRAILELTTSGNVNVNDAIVSFGSAFDQRFRLQSLPWKFGNQRQLATIAAKQDFAPFVGQLSVALPDQTVAVDVAGRSRPARPWLAREIAVAPALKKIGIDWTQSEAPTLPAGSSATIPLKIQRTEGVAGPVRLRLVTSQIPPEKTIKQNNKNVQVPDEAKSLRLSGDATIKQDANKATVKIMVPADLPAEPHQLAVIAELLSSDKKTVLSSSATSIMIATVTHPLRLKIGGKPAVTATAGTGETGSVTGTLVRANDFAGEVTISLTGLPKEYPSPMVVVPADATDFTLPIRFAAGTKPADLAGVRIQATLQTERGAVMSNAIPLAVKVVTAKQ